MRKNSFLFLTIPLLFSGCMQEKISTITPTISNTTRSISESNREKYVRKTNLIDSYITNISSNYTLDPHITPLIIDKPQRIDEPIRLARKRENIDAVDKSKTINELQKSDFHSEPIRIAQQREDYEREEGHLKFKHNADLERLATLIEEDLKQVEEESQPDMVSCVATNILTPLNIGGNWQEIKPEEQILETAKEYLGTEYIWAANGPTAFDCSGYTKYVFNTQGISLPRYSGHQAKIGEKISYSELQKGDLVFFDTKNHKKSKRKVNHVGIYLGDGQFIHASSAGKRVMITSFEEQPFYKKHFLLGRRVINSNATFASL